MNTGSLVQEPILSARVVVKSYRTGTNEVHALGGIDLNVRPGELVMVMGPSGNGKTTLLNCLSGLDGIVVDRRRLFDCWFWHAYGVRAESKPLGMG